MYGGVNPNLDLDQQEQGSQLKKILFYRLKRTNHTTLEDNSPFSFQTHEVNGLLTIFHATGNRALSVFPHGRFHPLQYSSGSDNVPRQATTVHLQRVRARLL